MSADLTTEADAQRGAEDSCASAEVASLQSRRSSEALAQRWTDPDYRARISALMKARGQDPGYRKRASDFHRDVRDYRWQHTSSGRIVTRTKREMQQEFGLKPDSLDSLVAGRIQTSRGWRIAPKSLLGEAPRWIFP